MYKNTDYQGYKATDKEIQWFWNILFSLSRSEKAAFLQFVTGSSKVPLSGFSELQGMRGVQKFSIHKAGGPRGALMSAHTCFNSLDLPVYSSEEEFGATTPITFCTKMSPSTMVVSVRICILSVVTHADG